MTTFGTMLQIVVSIAEASDVPVKLLRSLCRNLGLKCIPSRAQTLTAWEFVCRTAESIAGANNMPLTLLTSLSICLRRLTAHNSNARAEPRKVSCLSQQVRFMILHTSQSQSKPQIGVLESFICRSAHNTIPKRSIVENGFWYKS